MVLFQHDPYCPISRRAYEELARLPMEATLIDVAQDADIGRLIEERTGVPHESPQALVFRSGKVVWSASHFGITRGAVTRALQRTAASDDVEQPDRACGAQQRSAEVSAICVDTPHQNQAMLEKLLLPFHVLSDPDAERAIKRYGVWNEQANIDIPVVVVVEKERTISYLYKGQDFADRPGDEEILNALVESER